MPKHNRTLLPQHTCLVFGRSWLQISVRKPAILFLYTYSSPYRQILGQNFEFENASYSVHQSSPNFMQFIKFNY